MSLRKLVRKTVQEITTTANVPGFDSKYAFTGDSEKDLEKQFKDLDKQGYHLDKEPENDHLYESEELSPKQRMNKTVQEINRLTRQLESMIKQTTRLKSENNLTSTDYLSKNKKYLANIQLRLQRINNQIRKLC